MTIISTLEIMLRANMARLQGDMDRARQTVDSAMGRISASVGNAMNLIKGFAAALTVGAFVDFVRNSIDAADALNDMSARTKVAIEDLAGLAYAAKLGDTSLEGVAGAISKLGVNIGKDGAKFRELGITATEPLEAFKQLSDIFKNIQDPQQRAAFGAEALGKSWQEAAVLLEGGSAGISALIDRGKELSGITEETAAAAGKFNDGLDTLGFAAQGVGTRIAAGLLPILNVLVDDFTATGKGADTAAGFVTALSGAFKILYTVGVATATQIAAVGTAIGATAAAIVAAASGDFKGASTIIKSAGDDIAASWADAAKRIAGAWSVGGADALAGAASTKDAGDQIADKLIANATAVKVATFLNAGEIKSARDKSTAEVLAATNKELAAYAALTASIKEKMAADQAEIAGGVALTDGQKLRIKIDEELAAGKTTLTKKHINEIHALLDNADALEKNVAAAKQVRAAVATLADERDASYTALVSEAVANEALVATYGKTKMQIELMTIAREEDRLSQRGFLDMSESTVAQLEREIDARKRNVVAMGNLEVLEKQKKASADAAAAQVSFWKSIDDTAHDTFVSILDGSKDTATRLKDTFKNVFFDWLYQMTIKKWIINIGTSSTGLVDGIASAFSGGSASSGNGAGGILGGASNLLSIGKTIYAGFTTGLTATIGSSITSLGTAIGSEAVAAFGAGISGGALGATTASAASGYAGTAAAGAGAGVAGAIPVIGWIITAMMTANGLYKQGWDATNGTLSETGKVLGSGVLALNSVLKKFGLSDSAANIFSGQATISKLFGRKNPEIESQGLRGTLTATGTTDAENYVNILEKGGWFRSDKRTALKNAASTETDALIDSTMQAIVAAVKGFGGAIGIETSKIDAYTKVFDLKLTGNAEKDNAALSKLFTDVGDELSLSLVPSLKTFATEGEALSVTLQRLVTDYISVDGALSAVGFSIKSIGVAGIEAREGLLKAFGGLDALAAGMSYYQQNFLTAAQQLAPVQKQVTDALAAMGVPGLKTVDGFNKYLSGIDLSTTAGAELFAKLINLAPAFKLVADAAEALAKTAAETAAAQAQAAVDLAAAQAQAAVAVGQALLGVVDAAFNSLTNSVNAQKKLLESAHKATMDAMQEQIDRTSASVVKLKSLSDALHGALGSIRDQSITGADDRASALAQVATALAIARASGALPDADSLKGALTTLSKDSSDQFASYLDYERSNYQTAIVIGGLADLTDDQLSVEQGMLDTLKAQKDLAQKAYDDEMLRLDGILETAKTQIDVLHGINAGIASIPAALAALADAIKAVQANPVAAAPSAVAGAYQQYLGRDPEAGAVDYWQGQAAAGRDVVGAIAGSDEAKIQDLYKSLLGRVGEGTGVAGWTGALASGWTLDQVKAGFTSSDEYQRLHPFAVGTNYVPRDMPAFIHEGEAIIPAADNRELMSRLSSPAGNNDAMAAEIRELRRENAEWRRENAEWRASQEAHLYAIAKYGMSAADSLEGAVNGEAPFATKEIEVAA